MSTPFEHLRESLREAGCRLEVGDQFKNAQGSNITMLIVHPEGGAAVRCVVIDEGKYGYSLFIEQQSLRIEQDVIAILQARL